MCCRCGSSPELWFVHLSGAFVFVGAQTACAITEASEPVARWRLPLAPGTWGLLWVRRGAAARPAATVAMAAIAVVYPCLLACMIYVHNKKGRGAADLDEVRALLHWCETQAECDGALPCGNLRSYHLAHFADYKLNDWRLFFFGPQNFLENLSFALIQVGSPPYAM